MYNFGPFRLGVFSERHLYAGVDAYQKGENPALPTRSAPVKPPYLQRTAQYMHRFVSISTFLSVLCIQSSRCGPALIAQTKAAAFYRFPLGLRAASPYLSCFSASMHIAACIFSTNFPYYTIYESGKILCCFFVTLFALPTFLSFFYQSLRIITVFCIPKRAQPPYIFHCAQFQTPRPTARSRPAQS